MVRNYALALYRTLARHRLYAALNVLGKPRAEATERARALLARVGLSHREHTYPAHLSGGEQQRVAIARAFAAEPDVLLADEPTGNLDTDNGEQVMDILKSLNAEGATIVMVTHSPSHADYAGRVVNMLDGRILVEHRRAA